MAKTLSKKTTFTLSLLAIIAVLGFCGCGSEPNIVIDGDTPCFMPMKIRFQSSFCSMADTSSAGKSHVRVYVQVQDNFEDSLKLPGKFRIELYRKAPRSQEGLGERLSINNTGYAEFDLSSSELNQLHWDRITRSYSMEFDAQNLPATVIAQATFVYTDNYRLTDTITLVKESR